MVLSCVLFSVSMQVCGGEVLLVLKNSYFLDVSLRVWYTAGVVLWEYQASRNNLLSRCPLGSACRLFLHLVRVEVCFWRTTILQMI